MFISSHYIYISVINGKDALELLKEIKMLSSRVVIGAMFTREMDKIVSKFVYRKVKANQIKNEVTQNFWESKNSGNKQVNSFPFPHLPYVPPPL